MSGSCWWLIKALSTGLEPAEREVVLGDIVESCCSGGQALKDVLSLVVRREQAVWSHWRSWLAFLGLAIPTAALLRRFSDRSAIYMWMFVANWRTTDLANHGFRLIFSEWLGAAFVIYLTLIVWAWCSGFALRSLSPRAVRTNVFVFSLFLFGQTALTFFRNDNLNARVFSDPFYSVIYPVAMRTVLVLLPFILGLRFGHRCKALRMPQAILMAIAMATSISLTTFTNSWWQLGSDWPVRVVLLVTLWPVAYVVTNSVRARWTPFEP
jgi:hypothetical protein